MNMMADASASPSFHFISDVLNHFIDNSIVVHHYATSLAFNTS